MPRLNIEDSFFISGIIESAAVQLDLSKFEILGRIVLLWHRSQAVGITRCDLKKLGFFLELKNDERLFTFVRVLFDLNVLRSNENDIFEIVGNEKHIKNLQQYKEAGKKSGEARRKRKKSSQKELKNESNLSNERTFNERSTNAEPITNTITITSTNTETNTQNLEKPTGGADDFADAAATGKKTEKKLVEKNLNVCKSEQAHQTLQITTNEPSEKPVRSPSRRVQPNPDTKPVWDKYSETFQKRYGVQPIRNAQVNSQIKKLVQSIGPDQATELVEHYVFSNNSFYIQKAHSVGQMLFDLQKLRTEMLSGRKITTRMAKEFEEKEDYQERMEALNEKLRLAIEDERRTKELNNDESRTGTI